MAVGAQTAFDGGRDSRTDSRIQHMQRGEARKRKLIGNFLLVPKMVQLNLSSALKRLPARFYRSDSGREPVREWLKALSAEDRKIVGEDIKDVEFAWPIGMPLVGPLGDGLWEVRSNLTGGRIGRVLFAVEHSAMVLLHAFVKKTQKTPARDLDLARSRRKG
jgi:phage-related protein